MRKIAFIDIKTTGLDPQKNDVIQLAAIFEVDGQQVATFNKRFRPHSGTHLSPEALAMHNLTREELRNWLDPTDAYRALIYQMSQLVDRYDRRDKFWFVGYNASFDSQMVRAWFDRCSGDRPGYYGSWFWHPPMCVMELSAFALQDHRPELENWKLGTICRAVGIQVAEDQLHNATVDIQLTRRLWQRLEPCRMALADVAPPKQLPALPA